MFGQIKNKNIEIPTWPEHPFTEHQFQTKWYIVPIKDLRSLNIIFYIPDLRKHYRSGVIFGSCLTLNIEDVIIQ